MSVFLLFLTLKKKKELNNLVCLEQFHCHWFVSFVCVPIVINISITSLTFA